MQRSRSSSSYSKSPTSARHQVVHFPVFYNSIKQQVWKEKKQKDKYASDSEATIEIYDNLNSRLQSDIIRRKEDETGESTHIQEDEPKELLKGKMEEIKSTVSNPKESIERLASSIQKQLAEETPVISSSKPKYSEFIPSKEEASSILKGDSGKMEIENTFVCCFSLLMLQFREESPIFCWRSETDRGCWRVCEEC